MTATRAAKRPTNLGDRFWTALRRDRCLTYATALDLLDGWPDVAVPVSCTGGRTRYVHLTTRQGTWDVGVTLFGHRIVTITPTGYTNPTHAGYPTITTADALSSVTPLHFRRHGITGHPSNPGETLRVDNGPWYGCDVEAIARISPSGEVAER